MFAYGVYSLWDVSNAEAWDEESTRVRAPDWINVTSVTDLKVKLLEVLAVLLAVRVRKGVLINPEIVLADLVVPIAVVLFAWTVWLIRRAGHCNELSVPSSQFRLPKGDVIY